MKRLKNCYIFLLLMTLLVSCQDTIEVDLPPTQERLVIDAVMRIPDTDTFLVEAYLKLSKTTDYYADSIPKVNDALVSLTTSNQTYTLQAEENGFYSTVLPRKELTQGPVSLAIEYEEEFYSATTQFVNAVPIDQVEQGDGSLFAGDETEVIITYTDAPNQTNYYLFDLDKGQYLTSEDTFYQNQQFSFSFFYEDLKPNDTLNIELLGVNKAFSDFMTVTINQSGQASGNPFVPAPSVIRGNIVNETNDAHYPIGYFSISQVYTASIIIE